MRRHLLLLAGRLADTYRQVAFIGEDPQLARELEALGVEPRVLPLPAGVGVAAALPRLSRELRRRLAAERPDLVHLHGYRAALAGALAVGSWPGKGPAPRLVATLHNLPPSGSARLAFPLARSIIVSRARHLIFVCEAVRDAWGIGGAGGSVIYNPLPPDFDGPLEPRPAADWAAAYFGRLSREKGADLFIRAVAALPAGERSRRFLISGSGPSDGAARDLAAKLGVGEAIEFSGWKEEVGELMRRASAVVIPSRSEGLPLVALEALASGTPVIASRVGGLPEAVGGFGMLFRTGDWRELSRLIADTLAGRASFDADAASQWVRETFSLDRMIEATKAVYSEALED
jgi:glycosyltransferase involved in cell wall biosynthesis